MRQLVAKMTAALLLLQYGTSLAAPLHVLLLSGLNNHDWRSTTPILKQILETGGRFTVDVETNVPAMKPDAFDKYDVVLSNFNTFGQQNLTTVWNAEMRTAFAEFIRSGHGLVVVHAGSAVFYNWPEFQKIAGATWGRGTSHGQIHMNEVHIIASDHPVTAGLEDFATFDEFWQNAQVAKDAKPLVTVTPKAEFGGTGKAEPVAFATEFGRGRGFTLLLGHDTKAMQSDGFKILLRRGTEWAASGKVSTNLVLNVKTK